MAIRVDALEPIPTPEPERPPEQRLTPAEWVRENLFSSWFNTLLTLVFALLLGWAMFRAAQFVFFDARWEVIERNMTNLMVSRFPREELWRVWAALFVLAAALGLGTGASNSLRRAEVEEGRA